MNDIKLGKLYVLNEDGVNPLDLPKTFLVLEKARIVSMFSLVSGKKDYEYQMYKGLNSEGKIEQINNNIIITFFTLFEKQLSQ